jgi:hypothetical protein
MQILLTPQESEDFFLNALCNGLSYFDGYGLELTYKNLDYRKASETLRAQSISAPAWEDILMQILRQGDTLRIVDHECDGEYSRDITLDMVHDRVRNAPQEHLMNMYNEDDDAETADVILQWVAYQEIIFG